MKHLTLRNLALLVVFAVVVVGGYLLHRPTAVAAPIQEVQHQPARVTTCEAAYAPMETTVLGQGTLAPAQGATASVASPITGRILSVRAREGQSVTAGQVIAVVQNAALLAQVAGAGAGVESSSAQAKSAGLEASATASETASAIHVAQLSLDAARTDRDHAVKLAQIAVSTAETELKKVKAGARPQQIAQAQQAVAEAKATRDRAATEKTRVHDLFTHGVASQREVDDADTALSVDAAALETARQQLGLLRAGARSEDVQAAKLAVDNARQSLAQVQASGDAHVAEAEATLQQAKAVRGYDVAAKQQSARAMQMDTRQKQADLRAAAATAAQCIIRAPFSGTVTHRMLNPGDMADPTLPILQLGNTQTLNLVANLPAEDGVKVQPGMPVRMTSPDLPSRAINGAVLSVGQVDPATNLMAVRIAVANPNGSLKIGLYLQAAIVVSSNSHALVVPKTAVITRDGKPVAFTVGAGSKAHLRPVVVGVINGNREEIKQGLHFGDKVICQGEYELEDGAAVRTGGGDTGAGK